MTDTLDSMIERAGRGSSLDDMIARANPRNEAPQVSAVGIPGEILNNIPGSDPSKKYLYPGDPGYQEAKGLRDYIDQTTAKTPAPYPMPESPTALLRMLKDVAKSETPLSDIAGGLEGARQQAIGMVLHAGGTLDELLSELDPPDKVQWIKDWAAAEHAAGDQSMQDSAKYMATPGGQLGSTVAQGIPSGIMMLATEGAVRGQVNPGIARAGVGVPLGMMGLQSAGQGIQTYRQRMQEIGQKPDAKEEALVGLAYGTAEMLFEKVGLSMAEPGIHKAIDGTANLLLRKDAAQVAKVLGGLATTGVVNMSEEQLTQLAQNAVDRVNNPDSSIFEGVDQAGMQGLLQGVGMGGFGVASGFSARPTREGWNGPQIVRAGQNQAQGSGLTTGATQQVQPPSFDDPVVQAVAQRLLNENGGRSTAQTAQSPDDGGAGFERAIGLPGRTSQEQPGTPFPVGARPIFDTRDPVVLAMQAENRDQAEATAAQRESMRAATAPALDVANDPVVAALVADLAIQQYEAVPQPEQAGPQTSVQAVEQGGAPTGPERQEGTGRSSETVRKDAQSSVPDSGLSGTSGTDESPLSSVPESQSGRLPLVSSPSQPPAPIVRPDLQPKAPTPEATVAANRILAAAAAGPGRHLEVAKQIWATNPELANAMLRDTSLDTNSAGEQDITVRSSLDVTNPDKTAPRAFERAEPRKAVAAKPRPTAGTGGGTGNTEIPSVGQTVWIDRGKDTEAIYGRYMDSKVLEVKKMFGGVRVRLHTGSDQNGKWFALDQFVTKDPRSQSPTPTPPAPVEGETQAQKDLGERKPNGKEEATQVKEVLKAPDAVGETPARADSTSIVDAYDEKKFKGIPRDKPLDQLTDAEWETITGAQPADFKERNIHLERYALDPRFFRRITKGEIGYQPNWTDDKQPLTHDWDALRRFIKTGELSERGRLITEIGKRWQEALKRFFPDNPPARPQAEIKAGSMILSAIESGRANDYLVQADNKAARAVFTDLTGVNLPKTQRDTKALFTGQPFPIVVDLGTGASGAPLPPSGDGKGGVGPSSKTKTLPKAIADFFVGGGTFKTIVEARKFVAEHSGVEKAAGGTMEAKAIEEAIEHGVVLAARQIISDMKGQPETAVFLRLEQLYQQQPNLSTRTGQSMLLQAYSTPVPLAYVVARLARTETAASIYEPTAGTGMLLIDSDPSRTSANELDSDRASILKDQGFETTQNDGAATAPADKSIDAVVGNPPFGTVPDPAGGNKRWALGTKGRTDQIDHAIVQKSLEAMADDGLAAFVIGSKRDMKSGDPTYGGKAAPFFRWLYAHYNVTDHFTVSGDLYTKQGAGFPVDVLVIEGRGRSSRPLPSEVAPRVYDSWEALGSEVLNENRSTGNAPKIRPRGGGRGAKEPAPTGLPPVRPAPGGETQANVPVRKPGRTDQGDRSPVATPGSRTVDSGTTSDSGRSVAPAPASGGMEVSDRTESSDVTQGDRGVQRDQSGTVDAIGFDRAETVTDEETDTQQAYFPAAKGANGVGTVVPRSQAAAVQTSLTQLHDDVGDVVGFVASEMGWKKDEAIKRLSAEQFDAVGLAIQQAKNDSGIVVGDQTGVGKGRVVATMLQWAKKNGMVPVFVTQDAKLYGDILRDMEDIGYPNATLLPTNQDLTGKNVIRTDSGNTVKSFKNYQQLVGQMRADVAAGKDPAFAAIATTYAQLYAANSAARRQMFLSLADSMFMVMDESHNAGGTEMDERELRRQSQLDLGKQRGSYYFRQLVNATRSVMYSSATWAKRPNSMDLYSKTDLRYSVDQISDLGAAIKRGGVALQQIISSELVKLGQYVRRERSFKGVEYSTDVVSSNRGQVGDITNAYADIVAIDGLIKPCVDAYIESLPDDVKLGDDDSVGTGGVESTTFASQLHNAISQMNLSAKTNAAADFIIDRIKKGEKIVVALENTMQSLISASRVSEGASIGDPANVSFRTRLTNYLDRSLQIRTTKPNDDGGFDHETTTLPQEFWSQELIEAVGELREKINGLELDEMPVSPIDWLRFKLDSAGVKVGEITGRSEILKYNPDGSATYETRESGETGQAGQRRTIAAFQNGDLDVVILNASGATGISLHADAKRAKDHKPRRMVILQPIRNIDVFMQALGRVHRTGQVVKPRYTMLVSDIPSEKRPGALLAKKMASLNANVSSSRSGDVSFDAPDLFNVVGDEVVERWANSPESDGILQGDRAMFRPDETVPEPNDGDPGAYAQKITGRLSLLPLDVQDQVWKALGEMFNSRLNELTAAGENPLEVNVRDLRAKSIRTLPFMEPRTGPRSWFTSPAWFEKIEAKMDIKPPTLAELRVEAEARGGNGQRWEPYRIAKDRDIREYFQRQLDSRKFDDAEKKQEWIDRSNEAFREFRDLMSKAEPGTVRQHDRLGLFFVRGVQESDTTKNPMAMSRFKVGVTFADERLPTALDLRTLAESTEAAPGAEDEFDRFAADPVMRRWVTKGNLLQAWERLNSTGTDTSNMYTLAYTTASGEQATGIVFPRAYTDEVIERMSAQRKNVVKNGASVADLLRRYETVEVVDASKTLTVRHKGRDFEAVLPPDRRSSVRFLAMREVAKAAGGDFVRSKGQQVLTIPAAKLDATMKAFADADVKFIMQTSRDSINERGAGAELADAEKRYGSAQEQPEGGAPTGETGAPGQRATNVLDRLEQEFTSLRQRAEARMEARAKKRGTYLGMNRIDPRDMLDAALYMAAAAGQAGVKVVKGGRALGQWIRANIGQIKAFDASQHVEVIIRTAKALVRGNADPEGTINQKGLAASYVEASRKQTKSNDADVTGVTGAPVSQARAEAEAAGKPAARRVAREVKRAVRETWRKAAQQWALDAKILIRQARDAGKRQGTIGRFTGRVASEQAKSVGAAALDATNRQWANHAKGMEAQGKAALGRQTAIETIERRAAVQSAREEAETRAATVEGLRREVSRLVSDLPKAVRGEFVNAATTITTPAQLVRTINRMRRSFNRYEARQYARGILANTKASKLARLTDERRKQVQKLKAMAAAVWASIQEEGQTAEQLRTAADSLRSVWEQINEIRAQHYLENRAIRSLRGMTKAQAVKELVGNMRAASDELKRPKDGSDVDPGWRTRLNRGLYDLQNVFALVEGKLDGILTKVMYHDLVNAEDAFFSGIRGDIQKLEQAAKRVGYASLSDAQNKLGWSHGHEGREWVTIRVGGKNVKIGLGEVLELMATSQDPSTLNLLHDGAPIQFSRQTGQRPLLIAPDDIAAIQRDYAKYQPLIDGIRSIYESQRPQAFRVHRILKGFEPVAWDNYWPRVRNLAAVEGIQHMEELSGDWMNKWLENSNQLKERGSSPSAPIVIGNIMDQAIDHIETTRAIMHMALPIRLAADVLYAPQTRETMIGRFGPKIYRDLKMMLAHASRANKVKGTAMARHVSWLSSNLAVARLATNPSSAAVQLNGIARFGQYVPAKHIAYGVKNIGKVSIDYIMKKNGFMWDRYTQEAFGRFSPVIGINMQSESGFWKTAGAALKNLAKGHPMDALDVWRRAGSRLMVTINSVESIDARALWVALDHQHQEEHPDATKKEREAWVSPRMSYIFRQTQNGSSPLDGAILPTLSRDSGLASIFMFTSDNLKSRNRIILAARESKAKGAQAAALEAANIISSTAMRRGIGFAISVAVVAALGGDDDDYERLYKKFGSIQGFMLQAARDATGTALPVVTNWADTIINRPYSSNATMLPAQESINTIASSLSQAASAFKDGEVDYVKLLKALEKGVSEGAALVGLNPFQSMWRRILDEVWRTTKD